MPLVTLLKQEIKAIKHFQNDRVHSSSHFSYVPILFFKRPFMILILNSLKSEESVESVEFLRYRAQILHPLMHLLKLNMWQKILKHKIQYGSIIYDQLHFKSTLENPLCGNLIECSGKSILLFRTLCGQMHSICGRLYKRLETAKQHSENQTNTIMVTYAVCSHKGN